MKALGKTIAKSIIQGTKRIQNTPRQRCQNIIAQVVGWEKLDPTTKACATTMGHYTQCHLDVGLTLGGD
jgi:hypothetical protein